jgi:hypothetical protein
MRLSSLDFPQSDNLENILRTVVAIANGARTDVQIAERIPTVTTSRQGRYYRFSAQLLGFIDNHNNNATITPLGKLFVLNPTFTNPILLDAVMRMNITQKIIPFLEINSNGVSRDRMINYL